MKKELIEYYPNGSIKHIISYYENGQKYHEQFYDQQGKDHREAGLPDYQKWYNNGFILCKTYSIHGFRHNIHNPAGITFQKNGKFGLKYYLLNNNDHSKLEWMNLIKEI